MRWLGETNKKIKKLILVAPWKVSSPNLPEEENKLYDFDINNKIKNNLEKIIIFTSNDEEKDGKKSVNIYHTELGGEIIELKNHGHFIKHHMGTEEFPELLEKILE